MKNNLKNQTGNPFENPKPIEYSDVQSIINHLQGKILTIIEVAITEQNQLKAIKDLIKSEVADSHSWSMNLAYPDEKILSTKEAEATGLIVH